MDVILDANIYLEDIRFISTGFVGLFDYLKRTGHHLVIPEVVFQEVLARHKDRLRGAIDKAKTGWNSVLRYQLTDQRQFPLDIEIDAESKALSDRLKQPTAWIKAIRYNKTSEITAMDVAVRGINRVKPANASGEQLRDTLLWLQVLEYAQQNKREVAFITSNTTDFCEDKRLHPSLSNECAELGIKLHFYTDIGSFLQTHSLAQSEFLKRDLPKELESTTLLGQASLAYAIANLRTPYGYAKEFQISKLEFKKGTLFKITDTTSIAELNYEGGFTGKFERVYEQAAFPWQETRPEELRELLQKQISSPQNHILTILALNTPNHVEKFMKFDALISVRFLEEKFASYDVESVRLIE